MKAFALVDQELLPLEFFILWPVGILSSQKLLTLHANYYRSLTAIETGPKNLEYFILRLHHFKIRYHYVLIIFK